MGTLSNEQILPGYLLERRMAGWIEGLLGRVDGMLGRVEGAAGWMLGRVVG
jgi:hypothetical protein